jgi:hippurate hydrolase
VVQGYALANSDSVDITVKGVGGHGAYPQATRDPIVLASAIVMRLQTLISRERSPFEPAVITVGSFHAGAKHNIIPDEARLQLTVRSFSDESRKGLLDGIRRVVAGEAMASGLPQDRMPVVTVAEQYTRATYNTPDYTARVAEGLRAQLGADRVVQTGPVMAGEDFGEFRRADPDHIVSTILWVGGRPASELEAAKREGRALPSLHSPLWAPEADKVIATGAEALAITAMRAMAKEG